MSEQGETSSLPPENKERYELHEIDTNNCFPVILKSRKEELLTFNIKDNNIFFIKYLCKSKRKVHADMVIRRHIGIWFEAGKRWNDKEDQLFNIIVDPRIENMLWKVRKCEVDEVELISHEEMGRICQRILKYDSDKPYYIGLATPLYLEFFNYFDGYQDVLLRETLHFVETKTTTAGSHYEQNKKLNKFLGFITTSVGEAYAYANESTGLSWKNRDPRFLTRLAQEIMRHLSDLLKKNKFTHFKFHDNNGTYGDVRRNGSDKLNQIFKEVEGDLKQRTLIFKETGNLLKKYRTNDYSPTFELLFYVPKAMTHPVIVFEAIEKYTQGRIEQLDLGYRSAVDRIELVQFLFPELILLLDQEKQAFFNKDAMHITIDATNRVYRMLFERENQHAFVFEDHFLRIGGRINEIGWCNLAACDVYNIQYSQEVESANYSYWENSYVAGIVDITIKSWELIIVNVVFQWPNVRNCPWGNVLIGEQDTLAEARRGPKKPTSQRVWTVPASLEHLDTRRSLTRYKEFIKKCQEDGEYFYERIFSEMINQDDIHNGEFLQHDKSAYNLVTPSEDEIFFLQKFLRRCESVRILFDKYQEKLFSAFLKYMEDTMKFGSALIYHWCLNGYWNKTNLAVIEKKLKERFAAEEYFTSYFLAQGLPYNDTFKKHALKCPLAYCYAFVAVYISKAIQKEPQDQSKLLKLFCMTLHDTRNEKLRNLIYEQSTERRRFRNRIYYIILAAKTYVPLEVETIFKRTWPDVINLYIWRAEISEYDKSTIETVKRLEIGAFGIPEVVMVSAFSSEVVAKYFESKSNVADEIECLMKIQFNPHVVQIYGFIVDQGSYVGVLMEYCKGGSLANIISSKKIYSEMHIIWWTMQAASGLTFLHKRNIIHRDVKPGNMLLDESHNILKISDLGLSKVSPDQSRPLSAVGLRLSRRCGTIGYFPPNLSEYYSVAVDTFSLGRSIWSMIFRRQPCEEDVSITLQDDPPFGISRGLWEFVIRMMALDESERPTMEECFVFFKELNHKKE